MPEISALGLRFKSPIIVASTDIARTARQFEAFAASGVGGIVTKSVTDAPALQDAGIARIHIADMDQRPVAGTYPAQYYFFSRGGSMLSMEDFARKAPECCASAGKTAWWSSAALLPALRKIGSAMPGRWSGWALTPLS